MAFEMNLEEINHILLETYMGYGLYCKNIDDALWIALINGLFPIDAFEDVRAHIEDILEENIQQDSRSLATMDLWVMLSEVKTLEEFYELIRSYKDEFKDGTRKFGQCLEEVIEEEYGYYDKAAWFLRDIGCLHCEAQFSKIRAGKAVVTREWLLRFCIALQPRKQCQTSAANHNGQHEHEDRAERYAATALVLTIPLHGRASLSCVFS